MRHNLAKAASSVIDIGDLASTFEIVRELGHGGMGRVFEARDRATGQHVAMKIAPADRLDPRVLSRLTREARLMARLQHPNIVKLLDAQPIGGGRVALVMEYVHGQSLAEVLRARGELPFATCVSILKDLGQALAHAHACDVIHLDVKPANVLVEKATSTAKLSDFGIARTLGDATDVTGPASIVGTPAYMSPEQIDGRELDDRSDIYALGVLGWQLVSGEQPWAAEPLFRLLFKQKHQPLPSLRDFRRDVPGRLQLAIEGALEKEPMHRWLRVQDMLDQLESDVPTRANRVRRALRMSMASPVDIVDQTTLPIYRRQRPVEGMEGVEAVQHVDVEAVIEPVGTTPQVRVAGPSRTRPSRRRDFLAGIGVGAVVAMVVVLQLSPARDRDRAEPARVSVVSNGVVALPPVEVRDAPPAAKSSVMVPEKPKVPAVRIAAPERRQPSINRSTVAALPRTRTATVKKAREAPRVTAPVATGSQSARARSRLFVGDLKRAASLVDSALRLNPRDGDAYIVRARLLNAKGAIREAWTDVEQAARTGKQWEALALGTVLTSRTSGRTVARTRIEGAVKAALSPRRTLSPDRAVGLATALVIVGDQSTALTLLERAERNGRLGALLTDPLLNPIRANPRFKRLLRDRPAGAN